MLQTFAVFKNGIPVTITVDGSQGQRIARRRALGIARKQGIANPVLVSEHEAARQYRQQVLATHRRMLDESDKPFWRQTEEPAAKYQES
ncbi:MAG TPA: hypothetical protein VFX17_03295 [Patescibacteria group bacterium]|nr:hypothetical protein [Patescibacteria group bacterium]